MGEELPVYLIYKGKAIDNMSLEKKLAPRFTMMTSWSFLRLKKARERAEWEGRVAKEWVEMLGRIAWSVEG